ncbi:hypothetical protein GHK56_21420 [Sinorhizobium meliloti]|nr:hypothetical protein [Sinorhizobium meliloti]
MVRPVVLARLSADWTVPTARVYATCSAFVRPGSHNVSCGMQRTRRARHPASAAAGSCRR